MFFVTLDGDRKATGFYRVGHPNIPQDAIEIPDSLHNLWVGNTEIMKLSETQPLTLLPVAVNLDNIKAEARERVSGLAVKLSGVAISDDPFLRNYRRAMLDEAMDASKDASPDFANYPILAERGQESGLATVAEVVSDVISTERARRSLLSAAAVKRRVALASIEVASNEAAIRAAVNGMGG